MALQPTALKMVDPATLEIEWSDGVAMRYNAGELRRRCPCATCRTETPPVADEAKTPPDVTIERMTPVGNYAYGIRFSDGHDTGIFSFDLLRELGAATT